jgi:hypothetical protein
MRAELRPRRTLKRSRGASRPVCACCAACWRRSCPLRLPCSRSRRLSYMQRRACECALGSQGNPLHAEQLEIIAMLKGPTYAVNAVPLARRAVHAIHACATHMHAARCRVSALVVAGPGRGTAAHALHLRYRSTAVCALSGPVRA